MTEYGAANNSIVEVDFLQYCKQVTYGEITVLHNTEALKANALAIKMYAIAHTLTAGTGINYDITDTDQRYNPSDVANINCTNAMVEMFNKFMLDVRGGVFKCFYRGSSSSTDGAYCRQYGGIMSQLESNELANDGYDWKEILRYYYTRVEGYGYYNTAMNYGSLIFTYAHTYDWSGGEYCYYCDAEA